MPVREVPLPTGLIKHQNDLFRTSFGRNKTAKTGYSTFETDRNYEQCVPYPAFDVTTTIFMSIYDISYN